MLSRKKSNGDGDKNENEDNDDNNNMYSSKNNNESNSDVDDCEKAMEKDVVIIGNGPSGICLSYMLSGNWPYYTGESHPSDEMLTARLHFTTSSNNEDLSETISKNKRGGRKCENRGLAPSTRCKLECLSSGIEGRAGGRPLALLMDQLQHPCVDAGLDLPSLLSWKSTEQHPEHKIIDHVVLGKGQPGGAWQFMDPNVLTISLSRWMSLPGLDLRRWEKSESDMRINKSDKDSKTASRVPVGIVADYYKDYVRIQGLEKYFRCGTTVTSVRPNYNTDKEYNWIVQGYENKTRTKFHYNCKCVVLATGTSDLPNHLGIPGEELHSNWVTHDLNDLETKLDNILHMNRGVEHSLETQVDPVLVVGAGLSAADAIMAARFRGLPVLHIFRNNFNGWNNGETTRTNAFDKLQGLPSSIYPEYHKVYEMMADGGTNYPLYKSLPGYTLVEFGVDENSYNNSSCQRRFVILRDPSGQQYKFLVSLCAIFIGYKADLSYLENNGRGLGKNVNAPIDNKSNTIEVDDFTYEVIKSPNKGLYALGPLVGDNFVRFILGGAFGILVHLQNYFATRT